MQNRAVLLLCVAVLLCSATVLPCCCSCYAQDATKGQPLVESPTAETPSAAKPDKEGWTPLFNGKDLTGWQVTNFGGEGEVSYADDCVVITQGVDLSGVTSTRKDLPQMNYEIELEAKRTEGTDFFVGLTFPVQDSSCSLIMGGWGGGVCGISSIDGMDASENETTTYTAFENNKWYKVRVRVTDEKIEAWLDKHSIVEVETADKRIDVRFEIELSKPLGLSTYQSTSHIRNAKIRKLPVAQEAPAEKTGGEKPTE